MTTPRAEVLLEWRIEDETRAVVLLRDGRLVLRRRAPGAKAFKRCEAGDYCPVCSAGMPRL